MKKSIIQLMLLLAMHFVFAQTDSIYVEVEDEFVTIHHDQTFRNCGSLFDMQVQIENNLITVTEVDTGAAAFCECYFDLSVTIGALDPGDYEVQIFGTDSTYGYYWGSTSFTIEGSLFVDQTTSDCLWSREDSTYLEIEVIEDNIILNVYDIELNCCLEAVWNGWSENDIFHVTLNDVGAPCDCVCLFDLSAEFGPFNPGTYTLDFWNGIYGSPTFTIGDDLPQNWDIMAQYQSECYEPTEEFGCTDGAANNYNPEAIYNDGSCTYDCSAPNPAGCVQTGCAFGEVCVQQDCYASNCFCETEDDQWICTEDCGGGICLPVEDCAGVEGGSAYVDDCGVCCSGTTNIECSWFESSYNFGGAYDCAGTCFGDEVIVNCFQDPCIDAECPAFPDAECISNYCGGCNAEFYVDGELVNCEPEYCWSNDMCPDNEYCFFEECALETGICEPQPESCLDIWDPVCGCDGITYSNDCYAALAGMSVDYDGECGETEYCWSNDMCDPDAYCFFADCLLETGVCEPRPDECWDIWEPVCGCDGVTYSNDCYAAMAGMSVDYEGECETNNDDCPDLSLVDFGPCEMLIGWGWTGDDCNWISGCSNIGFFEGDSIDYSQWLFSDYEGCIDNCGDEIPDEDELCVDLGEVDFGDCEMVLGIGWNGEECTSISGCDWYDVEGNYYGYWLFDTIAECQALCSDPPLTEDCPELIDGEFGPCDMVLGWGWNGEDCGYLSGCGTVADDGVDYAQWIYNTYEQCMAICGAGGPPEPIHFTNILNGYLDEYLALEDNVDFLPIVDVTIESAQTLDIGDEISLMDASGIVNFGDCSEQYGPIMVGAAVWLGEPLTITAYGSMDFCDDEGYQYAGFVLNNPISVRIWDVSEDVEYDALITWESYGINWQYEDFSIDALNIDNPTGLMGDVNFDDAVDVLDIVIIVSAILLESNFSENQFLQADMNNDGELNILDVVQVINVVLSDSFFRGSFLEKIELHKSGETIEVNYLEGTLAGLQFDVAGDFEITDNYLSDDWDIHWNENTILLFSPSGSSISETTELFKYTGDLEINSVLAADWFGNEITTKMSIEPVEILPAAYSLNPAYPNPFNPVTTIEYTIPEYAEVNLTIFDINGRLIETLVSERQPTGLYSVNWDAAKYSSGIYLMKMEAGNYTSKQKLVLVK